MRWVHGVITFVLIAVAPLLAACEDDDADADGIGYQDVLTPVPEAMDDMAKDEAIDFADPEPSPQIQDE